VTITWLGHASFRIEHGGRVFYIDPYVLDVSPPKADAILVTHEHFDHCPVDKIRAIARPDTVYVCPKGCADSLTGDVRVVAPGDVTSVADATVRAVEAYNVNKFMSPGRPFHPRGLGVGYVLEVGGLRIYHAGDTDHIPEMAELAGWNIDVALLPIGGTYTMDAREAGQAVRDIRPRIAVPMHFGTLRETPGDLETFTKLASGHAEVRVLRP
jgi:L-ascorbate metabolism protein UlaG (beta-lactamase superfamily)